MKKIILLILLILAVSLSPLGVFAATTPTPTTKPSQTVSSQIDEQINNLKDKIASKVAQLKLVEKRGIIGTVTDSSSTQITLKDKDGNIHFVDVDELTKFDSPTSKTFGISDVNKNMTLGVLGNYNKESRRILARFVTVVQMPTFIHGAISSIDHDNYTLTIVQNDGKQITVEIEDITKSFAYTTDGGLVKSGFSKTQVAERIYISGFFDKQNPKELIASRITVFPNLPINPAIADTLPALPTQAATPSAKPLKVTK